VQTILDGDQDHDQPERRPQPKQHAPGRSHRDRAATAFGNRCRIGNDWHAASLVATWLTGFILGRAGRAAQDARARSAQRAARSAQRAGDAVTRPADYGIVTADFRVGVGGNSASATA